MYVYTVLKNNRQILLRDALTIDYKGTKTMGYDCVMIPGAVQEDLTPLQSAAGGGKTIRASHFCGNEIGLGGTKKVGAAAKTVCSKSFVTYIYLKIMHK